MCLIWKSACTGVCRNYWILQFHTGWSCHGRSVSQDSKKGKIAEVLVFDKVLLSSRTVGTTIRVLFMQLFINCWGSLILSGMQSSLYIKTNYGILYHRSCPWLTLHSVHSALWSFNRCTCCCVVKRIIHGYLPWNLIDIYQVCMCSIYMDILTVSAQFYDDYNWHDKMCLLQRVCKSLWRENFAQMAMWYPLYLALNLQAGYM